MIRRRHPTVAGQLVNQLQGHPETPFLRAAAEARRELMGVMGFEPPTVVASCVGRSPATLHGTRGRRTRNSSSGMAA